MSRRACRNLSLSRQGSFVMGDDFGPRSARPAHELTLADYWISRYPVTALEYAAYVGACRRPLPGYWPSPVRWLEEAYYPACGVSWREARGYCAWLSEHTGRQVRLPIESEWGKSRRLECRTRRKIDVSLG